MTTWKHAHNAKTQFKQKRKNPRLKKPTVTNSIIENLEQLKTLDIENLEQFKTLQ